MFKLRDILQEVGRRHVARVAILYAAVAFGALEAADIVIPALGFPPWTIRFVIALALVGFPVTLILAWIYDLTPRGVVRTPAAEEDDLVVQRPSPSAHPVLTAALLLLSGAVVAAAALFAFQWSQPGVDGGEAGGAGVVEGLDPQRIVVLPFVSLDGEGDGESFANGIHEDIRNQLMKIGSLEVISRSTSLLYRDTEKTAREIGEELGVGSILEGSVRKDGDRIRVVAQLTDARTDLQIWSETYDPEKTDILQVQSEIAQAIAQALQAELKPEELMQLEVAAPVSAEAYEKYAQGLLQWDLRENRGNAFRAVELFREATEADPGFAAAWAYLSQARMWLFWNFPGARDQAERGAEALDRALELAPGSAETRLAQGYFHFYGRGDAQEALRYFREAEALKPSDSEVVIAIGLTLRGEGRWEEALAAFERARTLDYRSYNLVYTLGETCLRMRRFDEAERYFRSAVTLNPEIMSAHRALLRTRLFATGEIEAAEGYLDELPRSSSPLLRGAMEAELAYFRGDLQGALAGWPGGPQGGRGRFQGSQGGGAQGHERRALLHHLLGQEELREAYADSLRGSAQATLDLAGAGPGAVQTGVIAGAHAKLGIAYALMGESVRAVVEGSRAVSTLPLTADAYEGADHLRDLIVIYTLIGAPDLALQEAATALSVPSPLTLAELALDPLFAPLREDSGFGALQEAVR